MTNNTAPAQSKRVAVANKIKRYTKPVLITTTAVAGAYIVIKHQQEVAATLAWHQQRINDLVEASNQLLEDVRNLQA